MPAIPGARRLQGEGAPRQRFAWYCPHGCKPLNEPMGHEQNPKAAESAGLRHFYDHHDHPKEPTR
jgi:hypothetical protein